jgi:hypothetical protein
MYLIGAVISQAKACGYKSIPFVQPLPEGPLLVRIPLRIG